MELGSLKRSNSKVPFEYKINNDQKQEDKVNAKEKQYFKGKVFTFPNVFLHYIQKHNCVRMIDYEILAYDKKVIQDLNVISFMCLNAQLSEETGISAPKTSRSISQ